MEFKEIARIIAISVAILFIGATASGQECVHSNGFLTELSPGTTYTMKPLIDEGYITPVKTGMETGLPCIFTFSVPKKSYVRIRFEFIG